ncbi:MAG: hypothetical protein FWC61_02010 [Proteobacteria bacterium]|nr:hypothetical protein [Pseudomonadota bacterium]
MLCAKPVVTISGQTGTGKTTLLNNLAARFPNAKILHTGDICRYMGLTLAEMGQNVSDADPGIIKFIIRDANFYSEFSNAAASGRLRAEGVAQLATLFMTDPKSMWAVRFSIVQYFLTPVPGKDFTIADTHNETSFYWPFVWLPITLTAPQKVRYGRKHPSTPKELRFRDETDAMKSAHHPRARHIDTHEFNIAQTADIAGAMIMNRLSPMISFSGTVEILDQTRYLNNLIKQSNHKII